MQGVKAYYIKGMVGAFALAAALVGCLACLAVSLDTQTYIGAYAAVAAALGVYHVVTGRWYLSVLGQAPQKIARFYMIHAILRFVVAGAIALVATLLVKEGTGVKPLLLSFAALFVLVLAAESYLFVQIEKRINEKTDK